MAGPYPVEALERGYYGTIREPGDPFAIAKVSDLGSWMLPIGWDPDDEKPKVDKVGKAELKQIDDETEAGKAAQEASTKNAKLFRGVKEIYGPAEFEITESLVLEHALKKFDHGVGKWNELSEKDRQTRFMASVKVLVNAKQAEKAAADDDE